MPAFFENGKSLYSGQLMNRDELMDIGAIPPGAQFERAAD
jgi:hypothetical protein